ncbi:MAG TPA: UDP-N-acetylmuramate--L-alanine ligase [Dermatophilaceae bacterium]|nr:UDP-N-acetylmuramate--L-alanine ligase [Dermatophilaceae bacterium]
MTRAPGQPPFDPGAPLPTPSELGRVHLLAIGGSGMSAVARLLLAAGVPVSGSDTADSATLADLAAHGAKVHLGHDPAHLDGADTVVVSSAIREDNVELRTARATGLRVLHRAQALAVLMTGRRVAAVAGANGKTTTTSMLTTALRRAGADPSFAIGGDLVDLGANAALGSGPGFVVEADESDGSFLVYRPQVAVVTNVQPDHLDFYGTFEQVEQAYDRFAATIRPGGLLICCIDDPGAARLADAQRRRGGAVIGYGTSTASQARLRDIELRGLTSGCVLDRGAGGPVSLRVEAPGEYNLRNGAAAFLAATEGFGADPGAVLAGLADYRGVRRRFEAKGEVGGVRVVDDYAHNPAKVAAVVQTGARLARPGRLVAVFQPHLFSRTRDFAEQFAEGLAAADVVVVLDVYPAREDPIAGVSGELVVRALGERGHPGVLYVPRLPDAAAVVAGLACPGDLVLTIGAGDVTSVGPQLLRLLTGPKEVRA